MVRIYYVYFDALFGFNGYFLLLSLLLYYPSLLLGWMFEHDCLDRCCFGFLRCMCFVFALVQRSLSMFHIERRSRNTLIIIIRILLNRAGRLIGLWT